MGFLSCLSAPKTDELTRTPTECFGEKPKVASCCTQTDVPEVTWLKEALSATSQSLTVKEASALSHDSLSASGLRTPHTGRHGEAVSSGRMSAVSPTSMQTPQAQSNGEETLMVASDGANDDVMQVKAEMKRVFLEFAQFGTRSEAKAMDVFRFTKLCRECDILAQPQDTPSINLIFYKCKGTKSSKMTFGQFKMALKVIADYLKCDLASVHARIARSDGPLVNNITLPRYVKQHDNQAGGPSPTASQRAAMTQSFLGALGGSPSHTEGRTGGLATPRGGSLMGGSTMGLNTPTSLVRGRTQGAFDPAPRRGSSASVGAWR